MNRVHDKKGILERLPAAGRVVLDLGCGPVRRHPDWIGVDRRDHDSVDIVGDVFDVLRAFPDCTVDEVRSSHFFEHVRDLSGLLGEIARVLKKGGLLDVLVPHFSNPYAWSDPTHCRFFGLYSFSYMARDAVLKHGVPDYQVCPELELRRVKLIFRSPYLVGHVLKGWQGWLVNCSPWVQGFYEENLCYLLPCYEIRFTLRRD